MLIGEIVSKTGLTKDTIRFYEKKGLIKVNRSQSEWNNYKDYDNSTLDKLLMIKKAKGFGFTLNEISELLHLVETNQASCSVLSQKIQEKLNDIDNRIHELQNLKKMILQNIHNATNHCPSSLETTNCQSL